MIRHAGFWLLIAAFGPHCVPAQPVVRMSEVSARPADSLAYDAPVAGIRWPDSLPLTPEGAVDWFRGGDASRFSRPQAGEYPEKKGIRLLAVVLDNDQADTCRLLVSPERKPYAVRFYLLLRDGGRVDFYRDELESWGRQAYAPLAFRPEQNKCLLVLAPHARDTLLVPLAADGKTQLLMWEARRAQAFTNRSWLTGILVYWLMLGLLGMFALLALWQYVWRRDRALLFFVLYLLMAAVLFWRRLLIFDPVFSAWFDWGDPPKWWLHGRGPILLLGTVAYQHFFLDVFRREVAWRWLRNFVYISNALLIAMVIAHYWMAYRRDVHLFPPETLRGITSVFWLFWVAWLAAAWRRRPGPVLRWILAGTAVLIIGNVLGVLIPVPDSPVLADYYDLNDLPGHLGVFGQITCFSVALSYRHHAVLWARDQAQAEYLREAEGNRRFQQTYRESLETELAARRRELEAQAAALRRQRLEELEARYQRDIAEAELLALREQLKPHFIANCVNSIRNLIARGDLEGADTYLTRLGALLRRVFDLTEQAAVSLEEELDLLQLYLSLEQLRFRGRFEYVADIDPGIDLRGLRVPPLLLQPYAENAVKHAFPEARPGQYLRLGVDRTAAGAPRCFLEDNGIGRAAARHTGAEPGTGMGMDLSAERLRLFNERFQSRLRVAVIDRLDGGQAAGTRVELVFE